MSLIQDIVMTISVLITTAVIGYYFFIPKFPSKDDDETEDSPAPCNDGECSEQCERPGRESTDLPGRESTDLPGRESTDLPGRESTDLSEQERPTHSIPKGERSEQAFPLNETDVETESMEIEDISEPLQGASEPLPEPTQYIIAEGKTKVHKVTCISGARIHNKVAVLEKDLHLYDQCRMCFR